MKKPSRQKPGPPPKDVARWTNCPEFFDPGVQASLRRLRIACDKAGDPPGVALIAFRAVNRVAKIDHWLGDSELGRMLSWMFPPKYEPNGNRKMTPEWLKCGQLYSAQPVAIAELLLSLSQFHERPPSKWPIGSKVMFLTTLKNPGEAGRLRSSELVEMLRKLFQTDATEQGIRTCLTREVRMRARVFKKWSTEIEGAARLQEAG